MAAVEGGTVMSAMSYFVQECPTCGRRLEVRLEYLGRQVVCQHCGGEFEACDSAHGECRPSDSGRDLLARADRLLKELHQRQAAW